jgi:hypothetical protein
MTPEAQKLANKWNLKRESQISMAREKLLKNLPTTLSSLRDDYSNQMPKRKIHGYENPGKYKVLREWWTELIGYLDCADLMEFVHPETKEEIAAFVKKYTSKDFYRQELTTAKDIELANEMINLVLRDVKPAQPTKDAKPPVASAAI